MPESGARSVLWPVAFQYPEPPAMHSSLRVKLQAPVYDSLPSRRNAPESDARSVSSCRGPEFPLEGSERRTKKKRNASYGRLRQQPTSVAITESLTQTDQIPLIVITQLSLGLFQCRSDNEKSHGHALKLAPMG